MENQNEKENLKELNEPETNQTDESVDETVTETKDENDEPVKVQTDEPANLINEISELLFLQTTGETVGKTKKGKLELISKQSNPSDFESFISPSDINDEILDIIVGEKKKKKNKRTGVLEFPNYRIGANEYRIMIKIMKIIHQNTNPTTISKIHQETGYSFGKTEKK